ncbi:MAG TPA: hypothetical protein GX521_03895 [Firmicutes bacterium]|nr:hypothetical protein [Bacillota bacterium]
MSFINDGHFQIGTRQFLQEQVMYMDFKHSFGQDERGFLSRDEEDKFYLQSVNHASLNDAGEIVYRVGLLASTGLEVIDVEIVLASVTEERKFEVALPQVPSAPVTISTSLNQAPDLAGGSHSAPELLRYVINTGGVLAAMVGSKTKAHLEQNFHTLLSNVEDQW